MHESPCQKIWKEYFPDTKKIIKMQASFFLDMPLPFWGDLSEGGGGEKKRSNWILGTHNKFLDVFSDILKILKVFFFSF